MGQMKESLKLQFLQICPLRMEKGEGAAIPTQAIPMQGQALAVTGGRGKYKLQQGLSPGQGGIAVSLPAEIPARRLPRGDDSGFTGQPHLHNLMDAVEQGCSCPVAEMV